jgi:hypothetical protein
VPEGVSRLRRRCGAEGMAIGIGTGTGMDRCRLGAFAGAQSLPTNGTAGPMRRGIEVRAAA